MYHVVLDLPAAEACKLTLFPFYRWIVLVKTIFMALSLLLPAAGRFCYPLQICTSCSLLCRSRYKNHVA